MTHRTPLRYPGGKGKLTNFVKVLLQQNQLLDVHYVEPYAGGAGIAISLLIDEYASHIHINDKDRSVYAFWYSVVNHTDELCQMIQDCLLTMEYREIQREIQSRKDSAELLELGFSTFYLNRTNRSGILTAGVIGGKNQDGNWKMDARFQKDDLIKRIRKIGKYKNRIHIYNMDAIDLINHITPILPDKSLIYFDPPYYVKGQELYTNYYEHDDHVKIANLVRSLEFNWIVSYDSATEIKELYNGFRKIEYGINYSAANRYEGEEIIFFSDKIDIPDLPTPSLVKTSVVIGNQRMLAFS